MDSLDEHDIYHEHAKSLDQTAPMLVALQIFKSTASRCSKAWATLPGRKVRAQEVSNLQQQQARSLATQFRLNGGNVIAGSPCSGRAVDMNHCMLYNIDKAHNTALAMRLPGHAAES
jgi:hypothetical protein